MVSARRVAPPQRPVVLLTGFDAFGGDSVNPSALAVQALHRRQVAGHRIVAAQLPTVFGDATAQLLGLLKQHRPALVVCTGLASGRSGLSMERVAINLIDARIADNAGAQPVDVPVVQGGPAAYFTTLPIKAMLLALQQHDVAVEVSQSAGSFVCNQVFYGLMHALATQPSFRRTSGGFIHLPCLPAQVGATGKPAMALADMVDGLRTAIRAALQQGDDVATAAGALH